MSIRQVSSYEDWHLLLVQYKWAPLHALRAASEEECESVLTIIKFLE